MAKLNEQMLVIKVSELLKDSQEATPPLDPEVLSQLEAVISELAGPGKVVELKLDSETISKQQMLAMTKGK